MIFLVKKNLKRCFVNMRSGLSNISSWKPGTRILMYHSIDGVPEDHRLAIRVPTANFENQLEELIKRGYLTYTVSEFIENKAAKRNGGSIVITFDDAYKDNLLAAARLRKYNMKATFFVTTSYINGSVKKYWAGGTHRIYMNWDDIMSLVEMGFEIGSHLVHHTDLTALDDDDIKFEFEKSHSLISERIKKDVKVFSYPYGKVNTKVMALALEAGYIGGCSSFRGTNDEMIDCYALRRTEIDGYDTISDFRRKLDGWYD